MSKKTQSWEGHLIVWSSKRSLQVLIIFIFNKISEYIQYQANCTGSSKGQNPCIACVTVIPLDNGDQASTGKLIVVIKGGPTFLVKIDIYIYSWTKWQHIHQGTTYHLYMAPKWIQISTFYHNWCILGHLTCHLFK